MAYQSELEKLTRQYDDKPEQYFAPLAEAFRKAGELEHAIQVLRTGLELRPNYLSAHIVLGRCLLDQQDDIEAARVFEHVLTLDAENIIALKALGEIAVRADDPGLARRWLTRLLEVDPMNQEAQEALDALGPALAAAADVPEASAAPITEEQVAASGAAEVEQVADFEPTALDLGEASAAAPEGDLALERVEPAIDAEAPTMRMDSYEPEGIPGGEASAEAPAPELDAEVASEVGASEGGAGRDEPVTRTREIPAESTALRAVEVTESATGEITLEEPAQAPPFEEPPVDAAPSTLPMSEDTPPLEGAASEPSGTDPDPPEVAATVEEHVVRPEGLDDPPVAAGPEGLPAEAVPLDGDFPPTVGEIDVVSETVAEPGLEAMTELADQPAAEAPAVEDAAAADGPPESEPAPEGSPESLPFILPEDVTPPGTGLVEEPEPVITETMAEVYAKQGLIAEARDVYQKLLAGRPGDPAIVARLAELDSGAPPAFGAAGRLEDSARDFLVGILSARPPASAPDSPPVTEALPAAAETSVQELSEERTPLETAFEDTAAEPRGAPTSPASDEVSLASVFGEEPTEKPPAPEPGATSSAEPEAGAGGGAGAGFSFDEFFGAKKPPGQKTESPRPRRSSQLDAADEDEFRDWLKGLKS